MKGIGSFFVRIFAVVGFLVIASAGIGVTLAIVGESGPKVPDSTVLTFRLSSATGAETDDPVKKIFGGPGMTADDLVFAIDTAATDPKVKGIYAVIDTTAPIGYAAAEEIAQAAGRFRAAGKFIYGWSEDLSFGAARPYLVASAFDEFWMQPGGNWGVTGVVMERPFFKRGLDMLGISFDEFRREAYKGALENYTRTGYSPAVRENLTQLAGDLYGGLTESVAKRRNMTPDQVRALIDRAPMSDKAALEAKLIDKIGYADQVKKQALEKAGSDAKLMTIAEYREGVSSRLTAERKGAPRVAIIRATGVIVNGNGDPTGDQAGGDRLARALDAAVKDDKVKAIILRVDSPGGSATASETIRRGLLRAKEAGKKVVVSMSDVAASGGYWISVPADRIVAMPATITGSIGVIAGLPNAQKFMGTWGIDFDQVKFGQNAGLPSLAYPLNQAQRQQFDGLVDDIYQSFLDRVAEGRKLDRAKVRDVAQGQVWSGTAAKEKGLVDTLGGMREAKDEVRTLLGLKAGDQIDTRRYPQPRRLIDRVTDKLLGEDEDEDVRLSLSMTSLRQAALPAEAQSLLRLVSPLMAANGGPVVALEPLSIQ